MKVGIGLPNVILDTPGPRIIEWAKRAEARGFSTLGTIGRVVYPAYSDLVSLAAAAGATSRIGLMTDILLGPIYDPVLLAKDAASLDQLSGGRFTLGASAGNREDDFRATGRGYADRGARWDDALELIHRLWKGEPPEGGDNPTTPRPTNGERVPMLIGGYKEVVIRRIVRWGEGWTVGGAPPDAIPEFAEKLRAAWREAGREGQPRIVALGYFALGPDADDRCRASLLNYYDWLGGVGERIASFAPKTPEAVQGARKAFEAVGCDEFIFFPTISDVEQVDLLADALGLSG
jgi:alkanesulfonate monooxygenase SsuD/methylene tetrahydromethanopterin reductase-like flavin-dependent oxidoreductase (luciferase family)